MTTTQPSPEHWMTVPGYGRYQISDQGRVMSFQHHTPHLLALRPFSGGLAVTLSRGGGVKGFLVQRLVMMAFQPLPEGLNMRQFRVIFQDDNIHNCRLDNLAWMPFYGEGAGRCKLTFAQAEEIRRLWMADTSLTQRELADRFQVSIPLICSILSGRSWQDALVNVLTERLPS
jgi:hypothetical protein